MGLDLLDTGGDPVAEGRVNVTNDPYGLTLPWTRSCVLTACDSTSGV
jgi:hypothetical protein